MRYIGGKTLLLENIYDVIRNNTKNVKSVTDIFSGSGVVSDFFKKQGLEVISNDLLFFSYAIIRGTTAINSVPDFKNLGILDPISYLNNLNTDNIDFDNKKYFIYNNYSPNDNCDRMYFQNKNAIKIDVIRLQIEDWKRDGKISEDEYYYLLAALLQAVPYVANIAGTFGAYLKHWDKRTYNDIELKKPNIINNGICKCFCGDYSGVLSVESDLLYADPPYNSREYLPNYHVLETIARYDSPVLKGVTGLRDYKEQKSVFCKKATVHEAFVKLLKENHSRYVLISYNNEGILSTDEIIDICKNYGKPETFKLFEYNYRRYKSHDSGVEKELKEQLYFVETL